MTRTCPTECSDADREVSYGDHVQVRPSTLYGRTASFQTRNPEYERMAAGCRPLIWCFGAVGITVHLDDDDDEADDGWFFQCYRALLMVVSIFFSLMVVTAFYNMMRITIDGRDANFLLAFYVEPFVGVVFLSMFMSSGNRAKINRTLRDILMTIGQLGIDCGQDSVRLVRNASRFLTVGCLASLLLNETVFAFNAIWLDVDYLNQTLVDYTFTPSSSNTVQVAVAGLTMSFVYQTFVHLFTDVFVIFQLFFVYLLYACFRYLNLSEKNSEATQSSPQQNQPHRIEIKHQRLAVLVDRFNALFSQNILLTTLMLIGKVTIGLKSLPLKIRTVHATNGHDFVQLATGLVQVIALFFGATLMASKLFAEAQEIINVMLAVSLRQPPCMSTAMSIDRKRHDVECHVTSVFLAQRTLMPVGIQAGSMFTINYAFMALVTSTVLTYVSTLSSL